MDSNSQDNTAPVPELADKPPEKDSQADSLARLESAHSKPRMDQKPAYHYEAEEACQGHQGHPEHQSGRDKPRMNRELAYHYEAEEACRRSPVALTPPVLLAPVRDSPVDKKPVEHTRAARRVVPGLASYIREMVVVDLWINAGQQLSAPH